LAVPPAKLTPRRCIYIRRKQYDKALADINVVLQRDPQDKSALRRRATIFLATKQHYLQAGRDMLLARRIDPMDEDLRKFARSVVDAVRYYGDQAWKAHRDADAIAAFRLGLKLAPNDKDLQKRLAFARAAVA